MRCADSCDLTQAHAIAQPCAQGCKVCTRHYGTPAPFARCTDPLAIKVEATPAHAISDSALCGDTHSLFSGTAMCSIPHRFFPTPLPYCRLRSAPLASPSSIHFLKASHEKFCCRNTALEHGFFGSNQCNHFARVNRFGRAFVPLPRGAGTLGPVKLGGRLHARLCGHQADHDGVGHLCGGCGCWLVAALTAWQLLQ